MARRRRGTWRAGIATILVLACTGCASRELIQPSTANSGSSPAAASASIPDPVEVPTVAEYLASQGIDVSGHPDWAGKGPADQYAGEYLMTKDAMWTGVWAQLFADYQGPIDPLRCDPVCSEGPTTRWKDGPTAPETWRLTMVVHGAGTNQGVAGLRVIDRAYADGVRVVLQIPPWEGRRTPSLDLQQAEALLEAVLGEYLNSPYPPRTSRP